MSSIAERIGVQFFEVAYLLTFFLLPVVVFKAEIENYFFGIIVMYMCLRVIRGRINKKLDSAGKAVFITGCDSGFGHAAAIRLKDLGYKVFAGCLNHEGDGAKELQNHDNVHVTSLDVTSDESVQSAKEFVQANLDDHKLWCVINNAGMYSHGDIELCRLEVFKMTAEVNLYGMIRVTKAFLPLIRKAKGRVVNMSSINGRYNWPSTGPYCASKVAVEGVSDCLRMEMVKFGVKVAVIEPAMFGGTTSVHSDENAKRYYQEVERAWELSGPEVKDTYSKKYMTDQIDLILRMRERLSAKTPEAVIAAIEDAVVATYPKYRYIVHGGPVAVDPFAVYGQLYGYLPEFITDWIACKLTRTETIDVLKPAEEPVS